MASLTGTGMGQAGAISAVRCPGARLVSGLCRQAMTAGRVTAAQDAGLAADRHVTGSRPGARR